MSEDRATKNEKRHAKQKVRAIDVEPYRWALWCAIGDGEPFDNVVEFREWSRDGRLIWFGLGTHHTFHADPDHELDLIPVTDGSLPWAIESKGAFLARRPGKYHHCCEACP